MCILVDSRIGSVQYAPRLKPSRIERLEYGDCCWEGADGKLIGVEIKKIGDAVSSLLSGRLADHQLPGMLRLYDCSYLVVEGYYRCDPDSGLVQIRRGDGWRDLHSGRQRLTWSALDGWLTSLEVLGGLRVRRTVSETETVNTIQSLYGWWQKSEHKSLHVFNTAQDVAAINRPGLVRRMAAQLPLIGWERSADVAKHFGTVRAMVEADAKEWMKIEGIGKGIASKVVEVLNGGHLL